MRFGRQPGERERISGKTVGIGSLTLKHPDRVLYFLLSINFLALSNHPDLKKLNERSLTHAGVNSAKPCNMPHYW